MPTTVTMPALSPTMEEGTLAKWFVKEGDTVSSGDIIAEIETDKATMEYEAVDEGTVAKLLVEEGTEGIAVNAPIAVILEEDEDESALEGYEPEGGPAPEPSAPAREAPKAEQAGREKAAEEPRPAKRAPGKEKAAAVDTGKSEGPLAVPPAPTDAKGGRIFASPLARRLAEQEGLDLSALKGSGPRGRVVKADIAAALEKGIGKAAPAAAAGLGPPPAGKPGELGYPEDTYELVKNDGMRKTVARRMTESKQSVPHFYLTIDCEIDAVLAARRKINALSPEGEDAYKVSVNDMIVKACALALMRVPEANASWSEEATLRHKHADIAVAVALEGGLITPIVWRAEAKGLAQISRETRALAERARNRKLKPEEYQGGTFSISNLGMFGVKEFSAVINPPHGAILAVGAGEERPVVKNGGLAVATVMSCTLACDHRAVDGATGARFLQAFKSFIEDPVTMLA